MSQTPNLNKYRTKKVQPLTIIEVAEAALLGDLALGLQLIGWFISIGALIQWFSVIPFALITVRHRKRATYFAMSSGIGISILIGGATLALQIFLAGVLGAAIGTAFVKNRNFVYSTLITIFKGAIPVAIIGDLLLFIFSKARQLTINQIKVVWVGIGNIFKAVGSYLKKHPAAPKKGSSNVFIGFIHSLGATIYRFSIYFEDLIRWITSHWYYLFPLSIILSMIIVAVAMDFISRPILKLVLKNLRKPAVDFKTDGEFNIDFEDQIKTHQEKSLDLGQNVKKGTGIVSPVPISLTNVSFGYAGSADLAVKDINLEISPGQFVGIVGQNGSGKSTLGKIIIGMSPTKGNVTREGLVGLGRVDGTSVIFQRPESQVLGSMVEDDVVWGLDEKVAVDTDIDEILKQVGLDGFRKRETSQLSGGELQRLALASALARKPRLLVSDESTALLDPKGRQQILKLLQEISASGTAVVHISHLLNELDFMDEIFLIEDGKIAEVFEGSQAKKYRESLESHTNILPLYKAEDDNAELESTFPHMSFLGLSGSTVGDYPQDEMSTRKFKPDYESLLKISAGTDSLKVRSGQVADESYNFVSKLAEDSPIVELEDLGHVYLSKTPWENRALDKINLKIYRGDSTMLVGENGSGKTTLSWILSGLIVPTEGKITWSNYGLTNQGGAAKDGILIEASKTTKLNSDTEDFSKIGVAKLDFKRKIENKKNSRNNVVNSDNVTSAIVFQHSVFQLTERDVKGSVKPIIILDNMSADDLVGACLAAVGFSDSKMLNRSIYELSGGEIKRVAIASVLALMPKLIIFDEPLAGLDFSSKFKVRAIIESLSEMGIATIVVSHDYDEILPVCKRVIQLGDGQIVYDGSSEVWAQSKAGLI